MLARLLISLALSLSPYEERDPWAGVHSPTSRNFERCESGDEKVCRGLEAQERLEAVQDAIVEFSATSERAEELWRICARESWCGRFGWVEVHPEDRRSGIRMWEKATSRGWLRPGECFEHGVWHGSEWAPRGLYAISPAYTMRLLPGCNGPELHDDPHTATAIADEYLDHLDAKGYRTCRDHVRIWVGPGKWAKWSEAKKLVRGRLQCGEFTAIDVMVAAIRDSANPNFNMEENAVDAWEAWTR